MSSKLTLYIEEDVIKSIKLYAKEHKLSVSKVVNNFLTLLQKQRSDDDQPEAPITNALHGVLKKDTVTKEDYHHYIEKKYL